MGGRANLFKTERDQPDEELNVPAIVDQLVIRGSVNKVVDDILDIVATDEELGKPVGNDLLEGIYTLPVIHALAEDQIATELRPLLTSSITAEERDRARDLIQSSNGVRTALDVAQGWADKAAGTLTDLPNTPGAQALRAASADLIVRANAPLS